VTVVAVDLDGLKRINDSEGHAAGDAALLALVRALYSALRDEDTVFRVGGDEFVILLPFTSVDVAELLMRRIQASGAPAFTWGAAGYPGDGADARQLVDAADQDLYRRRQGRRATALVPVSARPATVPAALRWLGRDWRWASVPAAAVVAAVVAVLVSGGAQRGPSTASGPHQQGAGQQPSTEPSSPSTPPSTAAGQGGGSSGAAGGAGGVPAIAVAYSPGSPGGGPGGGNGSSPGGPGQPPSPAPGPPTSPNGGLLGTLEQALAPVPLVGGNNGLVATVGQLLTGSSTAATGSPAPPAATSSPVPLSAAPSSTPNAVSLIRLLP
jgi:diguanylate cyclase (GGDEF)-like protein